MNNKENFFAKYELPLSLLLIYASSWKSQFRLGGQHETKSTRDYIADRGL